jgi:hypothetical protein
MTKTTSPAHSSSHQARKLKYACVSYLVYPLPLLVAGRNLKEAGELARKGGRREGRGKW